MGAETTPVISVRGISKSFGAVQALKNVSIDFARGEIVSIIGENGAGKSTLMKTLAGIVQPDAGEVVCRGEAARMSTPRDAVRRGIAMIHQELHLIDELSATDNIFLGRERTGCGLIRGRSQREDASRLLTSLQARFEAGVIVKDLSIAQKQMIEIARAVAQDASVLIMDEPTAVLSGQETSVLFSLMRRLRAEGHTIIYISHILKEVLALSDRIIVMRDGAVVERIDDPRKATEADLARLMVGRPLADYYPAMRSKGTRPLLMVENMSAEPSVREVSFTLHEGEILGFAGLIGSGRTETGESLAGLRGRGRQTRMTLDQENYAPRSPAEALRRGVSYLSEDRKGRGLVLDMSIVENTTLANLRAYVRAGVLIAGAERRSAEAHARSMNLKAGRLSDPVRSLSGGNQQKVAIAKWLDASPKVLILDEPTRGVDVGAKREIYLLIQRLASEGRGIIFISSELPEVLGMCHRVVVFRGGRIAQVLAHADASEEAIMLAASGVTAA